MFDLGFGLLASILVLIGATIGAVLTYLANRSRRTSRLTLNLIHRNQSLNFDALEFLESAWSIIAEAGFFGLQWHADWYGGERWGSAGRTQGRKFSRTLEADQIKINVHLYLPKVAGEDRYFHEALAETFFLLLQCDLWVKAGSVAAATAELSRFSLFLRHDMKNLAQYIELLDDQVNACQANDASRLLERLQRTTPLLRERSAATLRALQGEPQAPTQPAPTSLARTIERAAALYGVTCTIEGDQTYLLPFTPLDTALDNIFKNYIDLARRKHLGQPHLQVRISEAPTPRIEIEDPEGPAIEHPERLFEPFWGEDPHGLGVGLFQSRMSLLQLNGKLYAEQTGSGAPRFILELPQNP